MTDWGSVPGWLEAVGTVGSFAFIGYGLLREIRLRREDEERRRLDDERAAAERRDAEADMARLVTLGFAAVDATHVELHILNDSPGPIRRLTYTLSVTRNGVV